MEPEGGVWRQETGAWRVESGPGKGGEGTTLPLGSQLPLPAPPTQRLGAERRPLGARDVEQVQELLGAQGEAAPSAFQGQQGVSSPSLGYASLGGASGQNVNAMARKWNIQCLLVLANLLPILPHRMKPSCGSSLFFIFGYLYCLSLFS